MRSKRDRLPGGGLWKTPLVLGILLAACYTIEEPPCPRIEIPEGGSECTSFCQCDEDTVRGRTYRMTRMEIDEPDKFAFLLNPIWETDIRNNTLNVLFFVDEITVNPMGSISHLLFTAGPGWREPYMPLALEPPEGGASADVVDSYCMLDGLFAEVEGKPYHGYQCTFKSIRDSNLNFHSGPKDAPLVCAPENVPANIIPIKNLKMRMSFNEDCTAIHEGYMEGCITIEDAKRICMCLSTGACPIDPPNQGGHDEDDLVAYCHDKCGSKWISFGKSVEAFGLLPSCITSEGEQGYRLQGFFDAVSIEDKFNPVRSADCKAH